VSVWQWGVVGEEQALHCRMTCSRALQQWLQHAWQGSASGHHSMQAARTLQQGQQGAMYCTA
jgi:hypothetical protein